jgi:hypothetical protein
MTVPTFNAEASLYRAENHYRSAAAANHSAQEGFTVMPQSCGLFRGIFCGAVIGLGSAACTALCFYGPGPCAACWTAELGGLYQSCRDCIPAWMRALVDAFEEGGGGGGGGGGSPSCCPQGKQCKCGGRCVTANDGSVSCVDGVCLTPTQSCP